MNKVIQFRVNETLYARIQAFADKHDLNISEACRNLIGIQLQKEEKVVTADKLLQILTALGYDRISDIPNDKLDEVVGAYLSQLG